MPKYPELLRPNCPERPISVKQAAHRIVYGWPEQEATLSDDVSNIERPTSEDVFNALSTLRTMTEEVLRCLKLGPGGDHYIYDGSTTTVDVLKDAYDKADDILFREFCHRDTGER